MKRVGSIARALVVLVVYTAMAANLPAQSPFVTLEGKDFKHNGVDFYPIVMNYSLLLMRSNAVNTIAPNDIYFGADASYGPSSSFDCNGEVDCTGRLLLDFQKVKDMGFNTLRIVGGMTAGYRDTPEHGSDERRFSINLHQNPFPGNNHDANRVWLDLEPDYNGQYAQRFFTLVNDMLNVAQQADLKVILLVAGDTDHESNPTRRHMYPTFDQQAVDDYASYLTQLGAAVQGHPALLAYDLFNEPQFNQLQFQQAVLEIDNGGWSKWKKQDICQFTEQWYTALKASDPEHLVTLGGSGAYELEVWDLSVVHVDFYSLHLYPGTDYKKEWNLQQAKDSYHAELHWFGQVCPMPWIIGETGFEANDRDDPQYLPHVGVGPQYHQWPYMQGNEQDQADFVNSSMVEARKCGASGWSWWAFQEWRWWDFYYPDSAYLYNAGMFFCLLHIGDQNADWYDKPAVATVQNYQLDPVPDPVGDEPPNYYNWDNLAGPVAYSGTIVETGTGLPIKNAQAWFRWKHPDEPGVPPDIPTNEEFLTFHPSVTNSSGLFECYKPPPITGFFNPEYFNLIMAGVGTSVEAHGGWFDGIQPPNGSTFQLDRNTFNFDGRVENLTVASTSGVNNLSYEAWDDLHVEEVTVTNAPDPGATEVEFAARQTIHITGEFHAEEGSETHFVLRETFPDCDEDSYRHLSSGAANPLHGLASKSRPQQLRLQFTSIEDKTHRVSPNPFINQLEVNWGAEGIALLELSDATGRVVRKWKRTGSSARLEPGSLAPGPYYLRIYEGGLVTTHQIIKQP